MTRTVSLLAVALGLGLAGASGAGAATVTQDAKRNITFAAASGEANKVAMTNQAVPGSIVFRDAGANLTPGGSCSQLGDPKVVQCLGPTPKTQPASGGQFVAPCAFVTGPPTAALPRGRDFQPPCDNIQVALGDGNDEFVNGVFGSRMATAVFGEGGKDTIERLPRPKGAAGDTAPLIQVGGDGNDILIGREEANDQLIGGRGSDSMYPRGSEKMRPDHANSPEPGAQGSGANARAALVADPDADSTHDGVYGDDIPVVVPPDGRSGSVTQQAEVVFQDGRIPDLRRRSQPFPTVFAKTCNRKARDRDTISYGKVTTKHPDLLGGKGLTTYPALKSKLDGFGSCVVRGVEGYSVGIEKIYGGDAGDKIIGTNAAEYILGGGGNDTIFGGAGTDRLEGGSGNDTINGLGDVLTTSTGTPRNPNFKSSKPFKDTVVCGDGKRDTATLGPEDTTAGKNNGGCEKIKGLGR